MEICKQDKCTGCGMCTNICKQNAINMTLDERGFKYPKINEELCVSCGICIKKCPSNSIKEPIINVKTVYAAWNKDKKVRQNSTSGGIFDLIARSILYQGGYVAGVRWTSEFDVCHDLISEVEKLYLFRGSKYLQSDTVEIYCKIKEKLDNGKKVLFSGTPCQNKALRSFLNKEYDYLYQIDLVCHGVPSRKVFRKYLDEICVENCSEVKKIRFRHKKPYWNYSNVTIDFTNGKRYSVPTVDDSFFTLFNTGFTLRESCRHCAYTNLERHSDITLGDFWGFLPSNFKMRNYEKGISCILINSQKGEELYAMLKNDIISEKSTISAAKNANKTLSESFTVPEKEYESFWKDFKNEKSIKNLVDKYVPKRIIKPKLLRLRILKYKYSWIIKNKRL